MTETSQDPSVRIAELQQQLEATRENYNKLVRNHNELLTKYSSKIDECIEEREKSLQTWNQNEKAAAEKLHEGQLFAIQNDVEKQIEDSKKRVFEVILLKYHLLSEKLPKAAAYFSKFDNEFIATCVKEEKQRAKKIKIDLPNKPILPQEEIQKLLEECQSSKILATVSNNSLTVGDDVFSVGSTAAVSTKDGISFTGAIREIDGNNIYFVPNGGTELCFTVQAINIGAIQLSK